MEKILLVEDDDDLRMGLSEILKNEGYQIIESNCGMDALIKIENNLPDLIVSDIMMPGIDGYSLLESFRSNPAFSRIPIIFLSAKISSSDIRKGMNIGADDYITKPFNYNDLVSSIKARLQKKKKCYEHIDELVRNLTYSLPHELRTPLVSIIGFSEILAENIDLFEYNKIKEMLLNVNHSGQRLLKTIEKFLLYSELLIISENEKKLAELSKETIHNADLAIQYFINEADDKKERTSDFNVNLVPASVRIKESHFHFMIEELIHNAVKFSRPGTAIEVFSEIEDNRFYCLTIKDYGKGISPEVINNISPFKKEEKALLQSEGNGLGLSIIKKMTDLYCGDFKIESKTGLYTIVKIKLPLI